MQEFGSGVARFSQCFHEKPKSGIYSESFTFQKPAVKTFFILYAIMLLKQNAIAGRTPVYNNNPNPNLNTVISLFLRTCTLLFFLEWKPQEGKHKLVASQSLE